MAYLISILIAILLLIGFFGLTWFEERRGVRVFADKRTQLDQTVARAEFIWTHVDLGAFVQDEMRRFAARLGHDVANISLQLVRAIERLLTRLVRNFRVQRTTADIAPKESARSFVKNLNDFKSRLKATHPKVSDITGAGSGEA